MDPSEPDCDRGQLSSEMDKVIKEFLVECNEGLDRFDRDLVALEKDRSSRELLARHSHHKRHGRRAGIREAGLDFTHW